MSSLRSLMMSLRSLGLDALGADPDRYAHQQTDADEPAPQSLGDRAEPAEAEAARVLLRLQCLQVRDDVALVLRLHDLVGEDRHLLRTGQHGLVDVLLTDAHQRRRVLAVRK